MCTARRSAIAAPRGSRGVRGAVRRCTPRAPRPAECAEDRERSGATTAECRPRVLSFGVVDGEERCTVSRTRRRERCPRARCSPPGTPRRSVQGGVGCRSLDSLRSLGMTLPSLYVHAPKSSMTRGRDLSSREESIRPLPPDRRSGSAFRRATSHRSIASILCRSTQPPARVDPIVASRTVLSPEHP